MNIKYAGSVSYSFAKKIKTSERQFCPKSMLVWSHEIKIIMQGSDFFFLSQLKSSGGGRLILSNEF